MLKPKTTTIVPIHFPKIKPPKSAIGDPKPKKGNTQNIVKIRKITKTKNKLEFLRSIKYDLFSFIKRPSLTRNFGSLFFYKKAVTIAKFLICFLI